MSIRSIALLFLAISASAQAHAETLGFSLADDGTSGDLQVEVVDELTGQPIPDAVISLGDASYDDWNLTDHDGAAAFRPLTSLPKNITVSKQGYSALSILGIQSNRVTAFLKRLATQAPEVLVSGKVDGWQAAIPSGPDVLGKPVHVGLAFRTLGGFDLLSFNVGSVISPLSDTIDVFGPRKIPSNIVMPKQKIPVLLGSITVEKYGFRLPVRKGAEMRLMTIQGTIDSSDLIDMGQSGGKIGAGAINKFTFTRMGLSQPVSPASDFQLNLTANTALVPSHDVTVSPPPFQSDVLVAAVSDLGGDRQSLVPTDIRAPITAKAPPSGPVTVRIRSTAQQLGANQGVVAVAVTEDMKRLSGIIAELGRSRRLGRAEMGQFLPVETIADSPSLPASVRLSPAPNGISAAVFESSITIPSRRPSANPPKQKERRFPVWFVYSLPSTGAMEIPTQGMPIPASTKVRGYSLLQLEFSPGFDGRVIDGRTVMTGLRRFTRTSSKIGASAR